MGQNPAVVILVRHGARLDQANRDWVTSAERPWDSPLSYGGWIQCQTLGVRINNEINSLDQKIPSVDSKSDPPAGDARPKKKRKIIIHSSPYLRCVQTACAIAAGIQHPQNHLQPPLRLQQRSSRTPLSPMDEGPEDGITWDDAQHQTLATSEVVDKESTNRLGCDRLKLRIDPFLGEWLSPSYFENGPAPPSSAEMVLEAKETLGQPQEEIKGADLSPTPNFDLVGQEGGDNSNSTGTESRTAAKEDPSSPRGPATGQVLAKRPRNISFGTELANGARLLNRRLQQYNIGYTPPAPTYAMNPSDKIPQGFVAHARDACVDIDWSWDSLHEPLDWGDGGPYNEEWGGMHRRFRNGFQKMIAFYERPQAVPEQPSQEDEEVVLILVTHQAGCNALIRLLTGAPALHDIGTSSLTMAVRKQGTKEVSHDSPISPIRRRGSLDLSIAQDYEMKIIASTEHLRAGSNPLGLNSPRLGKSPAFASRRAVGADSPEGFTLGESVFGSRASASTIPARSHSQRPHRLTEGDMPTGLWRSGSRYSRDETDSGTGIPVTISTPKDVDETAVVDEMWGGTEGADNTKKFLLPVRSASQQQGQLWGASDRSKSPGKRRWTAVERSP